MATAPRSPAGRPPGFSFLHGDVRSARTSRALDGVTDVVLLAALVGDPVCKPTRSSPARSTSGAPTRARGPPGGSSSASSSPRPAATTGCGRDEPATEEHELNPLSLYAETKVEIEGTSSGGPARLTLPTVLRIATAYGLSPRMRFDLTVSEFTRELALGDELEVYDADTWRPYCHVADISEAIMAVLAAPPTGSAARSSTSAARTRTTPSGWSSRRRWSARRQGQGELHRGRRGRPQLPGLLREDPRAARLRADTRRRLGSRPGRAIRAGTFADVEQPSAYYSLTHTSPGDARGRRRRRRGEG